MGEQVYEISNIPMGKPSIVNNALKFVDQKCLQSVIDRQDSIPRGSLLKIANLAIDNGEIRVENANVSTLGVVSFVDLETFPEEFDDFIIKVKKNKIDVSQEELKDIIKYAQIETDVIHNRLLGFVLNSKMFDKFNVNAVSFFLKFVEKFRNTPEHYANIANTKAIRACQIQEEICGLTRLLAQKKPRYVFEVGTAKGGTFYQFCRAAAKNALLVTLELNVQYLHPELIASFGREKQRVVLLEGNSTDPVIINKIRSLFPDGIDFLFLDGDHSYEGIKNDFENYISLVNPGGLVAFHDIVEDNETRHGVNTGGWSGGVSASLAGVEITVCDSRVC